jgi:hypothetical protein
VDVRRRAEDRVKAWPEWALRLTLRLPLMRSWWSVCWLELWRRSVVEVVEAECDDEIGPWAVPPILEWQ